MLAGPDGVVGTLCQGGIDGLLVGTYRLTGYRCPSHSARRL